jgi:acyl-CoA synthetase (AMP-forming)/AMP-acid ligase II
MLLYGWLEDVVRAKGGAKALIYRDTYLSWRGLLHRVDRRADEFRLAGVRPGDWVGLMLGNVPDFIILSLALSKLDAAPLPLDPTTSTRELEMIMTTTPMRGLITRPRGGDAPLPASPAPVKKGRKQAPESRRRLQGTLLSCSIYPIDKHPVAEADEAIAAILFTADSAGDPKPVERTRGNLAAEAEHVVAALELTDEDRALLTVPLFHSFGFDVGLVAALRAGAALYLEDEVSASRIIKLVREQTITVLPGSPTLFESLARLPAARPLTHKPVRFISAGGGLVGPSLESFHKKYGIRPLGCLHATETGTVSVDVKGLAGETVGKPLPGVEVRVIAADTGKPAPAGRRGALWIRSDAVSPLHLSPPPPIPENGVVPVSGRDAEGWYRSGDLASLDRSGRIHLQGREDDLVRVDGKRVALGEVEGCIESFPKVRAAQALVVTDPLGGPMVVARVVLKEKAKIDPESIIDHCARHLSPYKVPRRIEFCKSL